MAILHFPIGLICHSNSIVQIDLSVIQLQAVAALLAMSKSILNKWASGNCGLPGNELADHQAKHGAAESQPDSALDAVIRRAFTPRSYRPSHIQRERLKEVHTSLPNEQIETSISTTEHIDLARLRIDHGGGVVVSTTSRA